MYRERPPPRDLIALGEKLFSFAIYCSTFMTTETKTPKLTVPTISGDWQLLEAENKSAELAAKLGELTGPELGLVLKSLAAREQKVRETNPIMARYSSNVGQGSISRVLRRDNDNVQSAVSALPRGPFVTRQHKRGNRAGKRVRGKKKGKGAPSLPPTLHVTPVVSIVMRFINNANVLYTSQGQVTRGSLSGALGGICVIANSKLQAWASSVHLKSVTIWPAAGGTCGINWTAGGTAEQALSREDVTSQDLPTGITEEMRPLHLIPPKWTYLRNWQMLDINPTDVLFQYYGSSGSVWDFHFVFTLGTGVATNQLTIASGTQGTVYYLSLDLGSPGKLVPQGVPYTS